MRIIRPCRTSSRSYSWGRDTDRKRCSQYTGGTDRGCRPFCCTWNDVEYKACGTGSYFQDVPGSKIEVLSDYTRQEEPPPTWRAIVNALRSPIVNLIALAKRVEAAHFPDPTTSRHSPTTSGESVTDVP